MKIDFTKTDGTYTLSDALVLPDDVTYSDEEIDAYIAANPQVETKQDLDQQQAAKLPTPEQVMGTTSINPSAEVDRTNENLMTGAMGVGLGAAGVGVPILAYKAGKAILNPAVRAGSEFVQRGVGAMESANDIARQTEARVAANQATKAAQAAGPIAPSTILDQYGRPIQGAAPGASAAANEASMASRVQQAAASNIKNLPPPTMMGNIGKVVGRALPGAGTVLNAADAYNRAQQGDYLGAGIAGVGAAASPFPVVGTAVGLGAGALNAGIDYYKYLQAKKQLEAQQKAAK
jgi:hypothetical protein